MECGGISERLPQCKRLLCFAGFSWVLKFLVMTTGTVPLTYQKRKNHTNFHPSGTWRTHNTVIAGDFVLRLPGNGTTLALKS